jgi:hypothetical protein
VDDSTNLLIVVGVVAFVFLFIAYLDIRVRKQGNLFSKPPTITTRIFAGFLGLVFGTFSLYHIVEMRSIEVVLLLPAIALIAYSLGATDFLIQMQSGHTSANRHKEDGDQPFLRSEAGRGLRVLLILVIGLAGIVLAIYGSAWIRQRADAFSWLLFIIGVVLIAIIPLGASLSFLFDLYRAMKNHRSK